MDDAKGDLLHRFRVKLADVFKADFKEVLSENVLRNRWAKLFLQMLGFIVRCGFTRHLFLNGSYDFVESYQSRPVVVAEVLSQHLHLTSGDTLMLAVLLMDFEEEAASE